MLAQNFTEIVNIRQSVPDFIAKTVIYMLPEGKYTNQPSQYRPIIYLSTIYKILTFTIIEKITRK